MTLSYYVGRLFSLDTLDTRLTASRRPHLKDGQTTRSDQSSHSGVGSIPNGSPPLWRTLEFNCYYVIFAIALPLMFKAANHVSNPSHPNYPKYEHLLSPGWIPGRKVDNSDSQYAGFRENLPYLAFVMTIHPLLRVGYEAVTHHTSSPTSSNRPKPNGGALPPETYHTAESRLKRRVNFDVSFAVLFLLALHGFSAFKILLIISLNYILAMRLPRSYVPLATWVFNIGILFANELGKGYPLSRVADLLLLHAPPEASLEEERRANWGAVLDSYGGLIPRWEILFNFTVLRMISFNLDFYWCSKHSGDSLLEKKQLDPATLSERDRISIPASVDDYSFRNYFAYCFYAPLYLVGPILTFNDYIHQTRFPLESINRTRTFLYGIRFLLCLLCMELILHFIYAVAICKAQPAWEVYSPFQLGMLGYFNLNIIWLKLLLPWRLFRLWALCDGTDPPENMLRCMSNNYSTFAFWRAWHRSYNRWVIRYIYIPLGGSSGSTTSSSSPLWGKARGIANLLVVFTFVAIWHDIQLQLLIWSWLITLFVLPEAIAEFLFPKRKWAARKDAYRIICAVGGVGNILMLIVANLVGFAVGWDGLKGLVKQLVGNWDGLAFFVLACCALFVGVQVMFEIREHEARHGIQLKC